MAPNPSYPPSRITTSPSQPHTMASSNNASSQAPPPTVSSSADAQEIEKPPEAVQMTDQEELDAAQEKDTSDSGKLRTLMGILKRMVGVKDMAAIRLSLPANLLEPVPNLEYWNYLDRGDIFSSIGELQDPLDRMLQVLRFTFTKELKFVHGKVCKPYNSILGEHFRCHWDISGMQTNDQGELTPSGKLRVANPTPLPLSTSSRLSRNTTASSRPSSIKSANETNNAPQDSSSTSPSPSSSSAPSTLKKPKVGLSRLMSREKVPKPKEGSSTSSSSSGLNPPDTGSSRASLKSPALSATIPEDGNLVSATDRLSLNVQPSASSKRITFLTEQVSHHPPISSFFVECKESGVQLCGVDQLSAKFTGTSVKVFPGEHNKGIFVKLTEDSPLGASVAGEEYQITHPTASINGLLRGSLWVAICDTLYITCRGNSNSRLRSLVEYKDESWLMKAKYALEGVIYEYEEGQEEAYKSIKEVPAEKIIGTFEGTWRGKITWKRKGERDSHLLINLDEIDPLPKTVRPLSAQEEMESRRIWESVTTSIITKDFSGATKHKQRIEQMQRDAAAERKRAGEEYTPKFFEMDISDGRPRLTQQGREAIEGERNLKGYSDGQNKAEDTREQAQRNAMAGDHKDDDGDDGDDDDNTSFRSAED